MLSTLLLSPLVVFPSTVLCPWFFAPFFFGLLPLSPQESTVGYVLSVRVSTLCSIWRWRPLSGSSALALQLCAFSVLFQSVLFCGSPLRLCLFLQYPRSFCLFWVVLVAHLTIWFLSIVFFGSYFTSAYESSSFHVCLHYWLSPPPWVAPCGDHVKSPSTLCWFFLYHTLGLFNRLLTQYFASFLVFCLFFQLLSLVSLFILSHYIVSFCKHGLYILFPPTSCTVYCVMLVGFQFLLRWLLYPRRAWSFTYSLLHVWFQPSLWLCGRQASLLSPFIMSASSFGHKSRVSSFDYLCIAIAPRYYFVRYCTDPSRCMPLPGLDSVCFNARSIQYLSLSFALSCYSHVCSASLTVLSLVMHCSLMLSFSWRGAFGSCHRVWLLRSCPISLHSLSPITWSAACHATHVMSLSGFFYYALSAEPLVPLWLFPWTRLSMPRLIPTFIFLFTRFLHLSVFLITRVTSRVGVLLFAFLLAPRIGFIFGHRSWLFVFGSAFACSSYYRLCPWVPFVLMCTHCFDPLLICIWVLLCHCSFSLYLLLCTHWYEFPFCAPSVFFSRPLFSPLSYAVLLHILFRLLRLSCSLFHNILPIYFAPDSLLCTTELNTLVSSTKFFFYSTFSLFHLIFDHALLWSSLPTAAHAGVFAVSLCTTPWCISAL